MKKEWKDDEAASSKDGGLSWPVWVAQLICEFLVIGTPPSSMPGNILIMYETLYDIDLDAEAEKKVEFPSINFFSEVSYCCPSYRRDYGSLASL